MPEIELVTKQDLSAVFTEAAEDRATVAAKVAELADTKTGIEQLQAVNDAAVAAAIAQLNAIPVTVKGLRVESPTAAPNGGMLFDFVPDATASIAATFSAGPNGGMLYALTGGN